MWSLFERARRARLRRDTGTAGPTPATDDNSATPPTARTPIARTRISGTWVAALVAMIVLIFLLIFILQNLTPATVYFLGAAGSLPVGLAMLFAAVAGALLIALFGSARILQLRHNAHHRHHR
jgi:uncharacterized integral membrane protein